MKRFWAILIASVMVCGVLAGCGSSDTADVKSYVGEAYEEAFDYVTDNMYFADEPTEAAAPAYKSEPTADAGSGNSGAEEIDENSSADSSRKIIKNVTISCETEQFDDFIANINARVKSYGGYIETSDISGRSINSSRTDMRYGNITARIPAKNLDAFIGNVEEASNVTNKNESAEDITLNYADTEAHISSLRAEQKRLDELLLQAEDIETIIAIESRITDVRYELESYESRLRTMDNKVDYSTVYIYVKEVTRYTPVPEPTKTIGQRISEGFTENLVDSVILLGDFFVGLITLIPKIIAIVIVVGIPVLIIWAIVSFILSRVKGPDYREQIKEKRTARKAKNAEYKAKKAARKAAMKNKTNKTAGAKKPASANKAVGTKTDADAKVAEESAAPLPSSDAVEVKESVNTASEMPQN